MGDSWSEDEGCPPSPEEQEACVRDCNAMLTGQEHLDCEGECAAQRAIPQAWYQALPWSIGALVDRPPASGEYRVEGYVAQTETCAQAINCRPHVVLAQHLPSESSPDGSWRFLPLDHDTFIRVYDPKPDCYEFGQHVRWYVTVVRRGEYARMQWSPERGWHR